MAKKFQLVGTLKTPQSDWTQTDETQLDYIKNKPDIDGMISTAETSAKNYADQLAGNYDSVGSAEAVQDALDEYIESNDAELATVKKMHAADKAELQTTINKKADSSIVTMLEGRIGANESAINTLNGTGEGSVDKKINDAFNDFATNVSNDATVNTYKELIDYAATHGEEFTELVGEVDANAKAIGEHTKKVDNPHGVTKKQVGLEFVPNVATNDQMPTFTEASKLENIASGEKVSTLFGKIKKSIADFIAHLANNSNPHGVSLDQLGDTATYVKMTPIERTKLSGVETGAKANVQSNWTQTSTMADDYIKNKPTLGPLASKSTVAKSDLETSVQASLGKADTALQTHQDISGKVDKEAGKGLSTNDFTNAYKSKVDSALTSYIEADPTVPNHVKEITADDISSWNSKSTFSGSYNDLDDKPDLTGYVTTEQFDAVMGAYINDIDALLGGN